MHNILNTVEFVILNLYFNRKITSSSISMKYIFSQFVIKLMLITYKGGQNYYENVLTQCFTFFIQHE